MVNGEPLKLRTFVDFPLHDLSLSGYVHDYEFISKQDNSCLYDLCGFINHYGTLKLGHYDAIVKNPYDEKWYHYDDTKVK